METFSTVGTRFPRVDGVGKVTGAATYLADMQRDGMLEGVVLRSPHPHARVVRTDASAARDLPGVRAVVTASDVAHLPPTGSFPDSPRVARILTDRPGFVGEAVAAVAADTRELAAEACALIDVEYEVLPQVATIDDALAGDVVIHPEAPDNLAGPPINFETGRFDEAVAGAHHVFTGTYTTQRQCAQTIEPLSCICEWDDENRLHIWTHLDNFFHFRDGVAAALDIAPERVRVYRPDALGATFGLKNGLIPSMEPLCAILAQHAGLPVRIALSAEESMFATVTRHPARMTLTTGVTDDGLLVAKRAEVLLDSGATGFGYVVAASMFSKWATLYRCEHLHFHGRAFYTNRVPGGAYRGVGTAQIHFAMESQMDEIAEALDLDPVELRQRNLVGVGARLPGGTEIRSFGGRECMEQGARAFGWGQVRARTRDASPGDRYRHGAGMALGMHHSGLAGALPGLSEESTASAQLDAQGNVSVIVAAVDKGQGALSTFAAIAAEILGLRAEDVSVVGDHTDVLPFDYMGAEASRSTFVMGRAVADAAERLREAIRQVVANADGVDLDGVELRDGAVVADNGHVSHSFVDVAAMADAPLVVPGEFRPLDGDPLPVVGAHFCEVRVDTYTGAVDVLRYVAAQDVGRVINRLGCEGQVEGGLHHGIGYALTEQLTYDEGGQPENPTFLGYKVMMAPDMPAMVPLLIEEPDDMGGPFGAKGIGTPVIPAIAPAVVNAIHDAVGVRPHELPVTPYRLLAELGVAEAASGDPSP